MYDAKKDMWIIVQTFLFEFNILPEDPLAFVRNFWIILYIQSQICTNAKTKLVSIFQPHFQHQQKRHSNLTVLVVRNFPAELICNRATPHYACTAVTALRFSCFNSNQVTFCNAYTFMFRCLVVQPSAGVRRRPRSIAAIKAVCYTVYLLLNCLFTKIDICKQSKLLLPPSTSVT